MEKGCRMNKILEIFDKFTKAAQNLLWWYLIIVAFGAGMAYYITTLDAVARVFCGIVSILALILIWIAFSHWQLKNSYRR